MKKILLGLLAAVGSSLAVAQVGGVPAVSNATEKPQILFVCGGNTGRSVMASWYTNAKYGNMVDGFSRGSGIDPLDDFTPEPNAVQLLLENHYATANQIKMQRATPATIQDINNSNVILTMTSSHRERLFKLIDRECLDSNIEMRGLSENSKAQWHAMCNDKALLKAKIHTLIGCATGVDGDVDDAYGKDMSFYKATLAAIQNNVDKIALNYRKTGHWCK